MAIRNNIFSAFAMTYLVFCTSSVLGQDSLPFSWLEGQWSLQQSKGLLIERWHWVSDSTLVGRSVMVKNNADTTLLETLKLSFNQGNWYYSSTVAGQNNNLAVNFKLVFLKGQEFIVENLQHDFPTRIAYRRIGNNLYASIEGRKQEKIDKRNFDYVKVIE